MSFRELTSAEILRPTVKLERLYEEIKCKIPRFVNIVRHVRDLIDLFRTWYNTDKPYTSLDWNNLETSVQMFSKKYQNLEQSLLTTKQKKNTM